MTAHRTPPSRPLADHPDFYLDPNGRPFLRKYDAEQMTKLDADIAALVADYDARHPDALYTGLTTFDAEPQPRTVAPKKREPVKVAPRKQPTNRVTKVEYESILAAHPNHATIMQLAKMCGVTKYIIYDCIKRGTGGLRAIEVITPERTTCYPRSLIPPDAVASYLAYRRAAGLKVISDTILTEIE